MKIQLFLILFTISSCSQAPQLSNPVTTESIQTKAKSCICPKMWMPVCGEDKKTYGNTCEANCAGVKFTPGACENKI